MPSVSPPERATPAMFRRARFASWVLLGAGLLLLVVNAVWRLDWGPWAVGLLTAGYAAGVIAVLPIIGRTVRAFVEALAAFLPTTLALAVAAALLVGLTWFVAWAWVATPW